MIGTMELPTLALKLGSQHKIISIGKCMVSEKPHFKKFQSKGPIHKPLILWITENYTTYITLTEVAGEGGPDLAPKNFHRPKSLGTLWDEEICEKIFFYLA